MKGTSEYIPYESIAPVILRDKSIPEYPFFSGTGFFVQFPPYPNVYFVTARHCLSFDKDEENMAVADLVIPFSNQSDTPIKFSSCHGGGYRIDLEGELEDVVICEVDETHERHEVLAERSLKLVHKEDVDLILQQLESRKENVRVVGYPGTDKEIDYEVPQARFKSRGFYGIMSGRSGIDNRYTISNTNWKDGEISGFSGSPVLSLHPTFNGDVAVIVVGMLLTGHAASASFISINVVTDLIADFYLDKVANTYQPSRCQ